MKNLVDNVSTIIVEDQHPLKQGLKRDKKGGHMIDHQSRRPTSTKTRIETRICQVLKKL